MNRRDFLKSTTALVALPLAVPLVMSDPVTSTMIPPHWREINHNAALYDLLERRLRQARDGVAAKLDTIVDRAFAEGSNPGFKGGLAELIPEDPLT